MKASDNVFPKVLLAEGTAPATPDAGEVVMYAKADGLLYAKDDAGAETQLGGGGDVESVNGQTGAVVLDAADIGYDNSTSGLTATDVQAAIDEIVGAGGGTVSSVNGATGAVVLTEGDIVAGINAQTGTTYTAVLTDEVVTMDNAAANTLTIPPNSSVAFPVGCSLEVWQAGAGQTTIVADTGVTVLYNAANTLKLKGQNSGASLRKVATDTWRLIGDMEQA